MVSISFFKLSPFLLFVSFVTFSLVLSSIRFASPVFPVLDDRFFRSVETLSFSDDFLVCEDCLDEDFFSSFVVDFAFDPVFAFFSKFFLYCSIASALLSCDRYRNKYDFLI